MDEMDKMVKITKNQDNKRRNDKVEKHGVTFTEQAWRDFLNFLQTKGIDAPAPGTTNIVVDTKIEEEDDDEEAESIAETFQRMGNAIRSIGNALPKPTIDLTPKKVVNPTPKQVRQTRSEIQDAIREIMADAGEPMVLVDIHRKLSEKGYAVQLNSMTNRMKGLMRKDPTVVHIERGVYGIQHIGIYPPYKEGEDYEN